MTLTYTRKKKVSILTVFIFLFFSPNFCVVAQENCVDLLGVTKPVQADTSLSFHYIDSETGDLSFINTWSSNNPPVIFNNSAITIDPNSGRIFFVPTDQSNSSWVDLTIATTESSSSVIGASLEELQFHCKSNEVFGLSVNNSQVQFGNIDAADGSFNNIGSSINLPSGFSILAGSSTIDTEENRFFFIAVNDASGEYLLYTINTATGASSNFSFRDFSPIDLEYDVTDGLLIALSEQAEVWQIEPNSQNINNVGSVGISPFSLPPASAALDPFTNILYFIAEESPNTFRLYSVSSENGQPVTQPALIGDQLFGLTAATPCEATPDFEFENTCEGDQTQFTDRSLGANQWTWDFGDGSDPVAEQNPTHQYDAPGDYEVTLTIDGCLGNNNVMLPITIIEAPIVDLGVDVGTCADSYTLDATIESPEFPADATFQWQHSPGTNSPQITVTTSACYTLKVSVGNCSREDEVCVDLGESGGDTTVDFVGVSDGDVFCQGEEVVLALSVNGDTYNWSTGGTTPTIPVTTSGNYQVTVTAGSCDLTGEINLEFLPPTVIDLGDDVTECEESWELSPGNNLDPQSTYEWSTGENTPSITVNQADVYAVTVTEPNKCPAIDSIEVLLFGSFEPSISDSDTLRVCESDPSPVLDASPPNIDPSLVTYSWSTGETSPSITVTQPNSATYSVEVRVGTCSTKTAEVFLEFFPDITVDLGDSNVSVCEGESITLSDPNLAGDVIYVWSTPNGVVASSTIEASVAGTYSVTVSSAGGCTASDGVTLQTLQARTINLGETRTICALVGETDSLDAGSGGVSYNWSSGETTQSIVATSAGTYSVEVLDQAGCTSTGSILVEEKCASTLFFPSAFSPNEDALNDFFRPTGRFVEDYQFSVFNRWGDLLFQTDNVEEGWDGNFDFKQQPMGVYVWSVSYTDNEGETITKQGNFTLIR